MTTIEMPNAQLLPFIVGELQAVEGKTATLPLRGRSMRPFLEDGRDKAVLTAARAGGVKVGDAVLAEVAPGVYVLHRIVGIEGSRVTLRGDGNTGCEHCRLTDVKAVATAFYRKGRNTADSTSGWKWRLYSWLWTRLYPVRRYLLLVLYPHIPNLLKRK